MIFRLALVAALASLLGGCNWQTVSGSVASGECKVFERPPYAVRGLRSYDQHWVNSQVEGGIGACGWARPAARPPELDAVAVQKRAAPKKTAKQSFAKRFKDRVTAPFHAASPVVASPPVIVAPVPEPPPPPPPKPRSAVDELLHPSESIRKAH